MNVNRKPPAGNEGGTSMRLTQHTDYALRVLIYAGLKHDALSTTPEIVRHFDIAKSHLMKVVHRLAQKGYLQTIRGKKGGMRLARAPSEINIGAVVRDMEQELGVLGCLQNIEGYCRIEECCRLREALREATQAFLATLDRYTIADLMQPRRRLARLLQIDGAPDHSNAGATPV
jgi:Rrf2 family transcriptional regulator, nitric oxide-sensitive transcriptional repressor